MKQPPAPARKPAARHKAEAKAGVNAAHRVRIIGGQWKRTPLAVPDLPGLRPTPDRVRETLFNWLNHLLATPWHEARCLDLFAGTGALGFEAASRGAHAVLMAESSRVAMQQLAANKDKLRAQQVTLRLADAFDLAEELGRGAALGQGARFDLIFLDPPYQQGWLPRLLPLCLPLLADEGLVYAESELRLDAGADEAEAGKGVDWMQGWSVLRSGKAGKVYFYLLKRMNSL